jgi:DsbC/DsbD-like thiol-disulfide interchange protein
MLNPVAFAFFFILGCVSAAAAALDQSAARLFQARAQHDTWTAGLEITLAEGWKTYWRLPGDSGVPPQFDWSRSTNLAAVTVGWPAPRRFNDAAGETIGYRDRIVLPLRVDPADPQKPIGLALSLFYAVCKDICIPVQENLTVEIDPQGQGSAADQALLEDFASRIPSTPGNGSLPRIRALRVIGSGADSLLEVVVVGKLPPASTDIFVEGYPKAYFRKPSFAETMNDASRFHLKIDGLTNGAELRGRELTLTLTSGAGSLVQTMIVE